MRIAAYRLRVRGLLQIKITNRLWNRQLGEARRRVSLLRLTNHTDFYDVPFGVDCCPEGDHITGCKGDGRD